MIPCVAIHKKQVILRTERLTYGNVSSMATTVEGIGIRNGRVLARVGITNKVVAALHKEFRTNATTEGRVLVINTRINAAPGE